MSAVLGGIALGGALGGFINGLAGFGTGLFALGIWLNVLPPQQAVALTVLVATMTGTQGLWVVRHEIKANVHRFTRFLIPALFGLPLGAFLLQFIDPDALKILIGSLMLGYGVFFLARQSLPSFTRPTPGADIAVGWVAGVLGGLAGLSGALMVPWCGLRPWTKGETRAVLQPFNFVLLAIMTTSFAWRGVYTAPLLAQFVVALVVAMVAAQVGIWTFRRLSDRQFRWLLIGLMALSGASLLGRTLIL